MKKFLLIILFTIIVIGLYLNRSYAHIYQKINQAHLKFPDAKQTYLVGNNLNYDKQLIYVALGDSLTAGVGVDSYEQSFPYLLAQKVSETDNKVILSDRSIPGAKVADLQKSLVEKAIQDKPDIITILIGVNDIHNHTSKDSFKKNYEEILNRLTKETKAKVYLVNIPYIGASNLIFPPFAQYYNWQTQEFNAVIKNLADSYGVKYIDLYSPTITKFSQNGLHYSPDLFHPSAEGYAIWSQIIYDAFDR